MLTHAIHFGACFACMIRPNQLSSVTYHWQTIFAAPSTRTRWSGCADPVDRWSRLVLIVMRWMLVDGWSRLMEPAHALAAPNCLDQAALHDTVDGLRSELAELQRDRRPSPSSGNAVVARVVPEVGDGINDASDVSSGSALVAKVVPEGGRGINDAPDVQETVTADGWQSFLDPRSNQTWWWHEASRTTSWEKPL